MKSRFHFFYLLLASITVYSCQREITDSIPGPNGDNHTCASALLVKVISKSSIDSAVIEFEYDANDRLKRQFTSAFHPQNPGTIDRRITRDADGIIKQLVTRNNFLQGSDTAIVNVFYNATDKRYTYTTQEWHPFGFTTKDSIIFLYDASGKVTAQHLYAHHFTPGPYYLLDAKYEYTYTNEGNVSKMTIYSRDQTNNVISLESTIEYTYDNKKRANRLNIGDAIILSDPLASSSHNVTSIKVTNLKFPIYNATYTDEFTYNNCERPSTMVERSTNSNHSRKLWYYYR